MFTLRLMGCYGVYNLECLLRVCERKDPALLESYLFVGGQVMFAPWTPGGRVEELECEPLYVEERGKRVLAGVRITARVDLGEYGVKTFKSICYDIAGVLVCVPNPS